MTAPSVAIVYDKFLVQGGGERVCEMLVDAFPDATMYALNARPRAFWERRLGRRIISPPLGGLFTSRARVTALYPLAALLMSTLKVRANVVIAYSSTCGKFVRLDCQRSILYSNYPNRGLYQPEKLISSRFLRAVARPVMALMTLLEHRHVGKYGRKYSISEVARRALLDFSGVDSKVLMPPFDEQGLVEAPRSAARGYPSYFLLVSRIEPEKSLDYVVEAFRGSPHRLKIVGKGSHLATLKRMSGDNIEFLGYVEDDRLARELAESRALIFPSEIEYSLVPLEATFLGTPVISFDSPAMREMMIDVETGQPGANTLYYPEKNAPSLNQAIERFETVDWDFEAIKQSAARFGRAAFIERIRAIAYGPVTAQS